MTDYPVIAATETSSVEVPVVTQTETIIYNRWWQAGLGINARDPNGPVNATAMMTKGRKLADGTWELSKDDKDTVYISINDIFTLAESDPQVAQAIGAVLALVIREGTAQGKL